MNKIRQKIQNIKKPDFKKSGSKVFWVWIGYQAVKGTLTTSLIWIPLIYAWMHGG